MLSRPENGCPDRTYDPAACYDTGSTKAPHMFCLLQTELQDAALEQ